MNENIIKELIDKFELSKNNCCPGNGKNINDIIDFMKSKNYKVSLDNSITDSILCQLNFNLHKNQECIEKLEINNVENFFDINQFELKIENKSFLFNELKNKLYLSNRAKGNELVFDNKNAISGVLACIHTFIFENQFNEDFINLKRGLEYVSLYELENVQLITAGSAGNHRLFGCILFAPLLGKSKICFKNMHIYKIKKEYLQEIKETLDLTKELILENYFVKIEIIKFNKLKIEITKNNHIVFNFLDLEVKQIKSFFNKKLLLNCLNNINEEENITINYVANKLNFYYKDKKNCLKEYNELKELEKAIYKNNTSFILRINNFILNFFQFKNYLYKNS